MSADVIYEPTERQNFFHRCEDDYIILGGSRGSGKSMCSLIEVLGLPYDSHIKGGWQALVLRRTVPQLQELILRARQLYPKIVNGIKFNAQKNTFEFPSGSVITFASCERDEDVEKYRGREFNMILVDELSHFDNDYVWNWLKSCNRNSKGYPNRMIGTSNPCMWVKKMCKIDEKGHDTIQTITFHDETTNEDIKKTLRFIQLNLESNPHVSSDYKASLYQDEVNRDQFLYGLWKTPPVPGQVLKAELDRFDREGRIYPIVKDPELPVHVFTDIGYSDFTVMVFCQFIGDTINVLNYYENSQESVDHYIAVINRLYPDQAIVHLPHDGSTHESSARTRRDYWKDRVKVSDDTGANGNLPRLSNEESWHRVQSNFGRLHFDANDSCVQFIDHLRQYKRAFIETLGIYTDPIHDIHSHAYDAMKYIFYYQKPQTTGYNWASYKPSTSGRRSY